MKSSSMFQPFGLLACDPSAQGQSPLIGLENLSPSRKFTSLLKSVSLATVKVVTGMLLAAGIATGFTGKAAAQGRSGVQSGATRIGREALIALPESAEWSGMVNFRPGNAEIVKLNPPPFSWLYKDQDPNSLLDQDCRIFQFQVAYDNEFKELAVDVRTESNLYNFLAPFTSKQCWWRVGYIYPKIGTAVHHWSEVRAFTIADDATRWDRSMLADETYLKSKEHPRLLFNRSNREAFSRHVLEKQPAIWLAIKKIADAAITSSWWANRTVAYTSGLGKFPDLQAVAFVWQMTNDPKYLDAGKAQELLVLIAQQFIDNGAAFADSSSGFGGIEELAQIYDWLYEVMTEEQRVSVAANIGLHCKFSVNVYTFFTSVVKGSFPQDPTKDNYATGWYPAQNRKTNRGTADNYFSSHNHSNLQRSMNAALAAYSEDADARRLFDLGMNFFIGKPYYAGTEEGVDTAGMYSVLSMPTLLEVFMRCHFTFPETRFNLHPFLTGSADFFSRLRPIGTEAELFCWSTSNNQMWQTFPPLSKYFAWFVGDGRLLKQWRLELAKAPRTEIALKTTTVAACSYYSDVVHDQDAGYLATPMEEDRLPFSKAFPGWAFAASDSPTKLEGFRDGLGFVFCCRPSALGGRNHDEPLDLSFELRAYGQTITENNCANWEYGAYPEAHNTLMVNGIGPRNGLGYQRVAIPGRISAFKTTDDYTYCAGEGENFYPWATVAILNKVQRHLLIVRNKFFVIYDDMEAKQNATFSWVYHLLEDNLVLDQDPTKTGTFTYLRTKSAVVLNSGYVYTGQPVSVHVSHIASPDALTFLDLSGADRTKNPITNAIRSVPGSRPDARTHALWVSNKTPATKFHFMTVIYPVKEGGAAPTITRLDDFTAEVICGGEKDVISFDPKTRFPATLVVDLFGIPAPTSPDASGPGIRRTP